MKTLKKINLRLAILTAFLVIIVAAYGQYSGSVSFDQNELTFSTIDEYDVVYYNSSEYTDIIGAPQLPAIKLLYLIPLNSYVDEIEINSYSSSQISGSFYIYPKQYPIILDGKTTYEFVEPNSEYYNSNNPYPAYIAEKGEDFYFMGFHLQTIIFHPVQCTPNQQILNFISNIDFTLLFSPINEPFEQPLRQTYYSYKQTINTIEKIIENPQDLEIYYGGAKEIYYNRSLENINNLNFLPSNEGVIPRYIIITDNEFIEEFESLAEWKNKKGVPAIIVTTEQIYENYTGYDNAERIRNYLKDVYKYWGFGCYILFGGDTEIVPTKIIPKYAPKKIEYTACDYYFAAVNGNWNKNKNNVFGEPYINPLNNNTNYYDFSDGDFNSIVDYSICFYVGRAPVKNETEVTDFVNKVLVYEKLNGSQNNNYLNNILMMEAFLKYWYDEDCSFDKRFDSDILYYLKKIIEDNISPDIKSYFIADNPLCLTSYHDYNCFSYTLGGCYLPWQLTEDKAKELDRNNVISALNNGAPQGSFIEGEMFHIIYHMDHSGPYNIGTSNKILSQSINKQDVKNLNNEPYYQILFTNGCNPNEFQRDECFGEAFVKNTSGGGVAFIGNTAFGLENEWIQFQRFCNNLYVNNNPNNIGNLVYLSASGIEQKLRLNLLGDPEMPVWPKSPSQLTINNLPSQIYTGENLINFTIKDLEYNDKINICLYKENEVFLTREITGTHNVNFYIHFVCTPETTGTLYVTITGRNYLPVELEINVQQSQDTYLFISELNFNNDYLLIGDDVELNISLQNSGIGQPVNVNADIESFILKESFENEFPPYGWYIEDNLNNHVTWKQSGNTVNPPGVDPYHGFKLAYSNTKEYGGDDEFTTLITPPLNLYNSTLEFWMYHDNNNSNCNDVLEIKIKESSVSDWPTDPIESFTRFDNNNGWAKHTVPLNSCILDVKYNIGFVAHADEGNDIHIDDITISSPYIIINNNYSDYIFESGLYTSTSNYNFTIQPYTPINSNIPFSLNIFDDTDPISRDNFTINVTKPLLEQNYNFISNTGINNDITIDPFEWVDFYVELANKGCLPISIQEAHLEIPNGSLVENIINGYSSFGDIPPLSVLKCNQPFKVEIGDFNGDPNVFIILKVTDDNQNTWEFNINLCNRDYPSNIDFESTSSSITLFWDVTDNSKGYNIYKSDPNDHDRETYNPNDITFYERINDFVNEYACFIDTDVDQKSIYYYIITSVRDKLSTLTPYEGCESYYSEPLLAWTTLPYHPEWPIEVSTELGHSIQGSPNTYNIDNIDGEEIFLTIGDNGGGINGGILGFYHDYGHPNGIELFNIDYDITTISGFYKFNSADISSTPAIGDINDDGKPEIIVTTRSGNSIDGDARKLFAFSFEDEDGDNKPDMIWNEPIFINNSRKGPVLEDLNNDGNLEIIAKSEFGSPLYVLNGNDGTTFEPEPSSYWPLDLGNAQAFGMAVAENIGGDEFKEIIIGFKHKDGFEAGIYILKYNGEAYEYSNQNGLFYSHDNGTSYDDMDCTPVVTDIDNDGEYEIILVSGRYINGNPEARIFVLESNGSGFVDYWNYDDHTIDISIVSQSNNTMWLPSIAVADIDNDNFIEVFVAEKNKLYAWDYKGDILDNFPIIIENLEGKLLCPLIADINADHELEIIVSSNKGYIFAFNKLGELEPGWPLKTESIKATPCIADIDGDNLNEIIVGSDNMVHIWDTEGSAENVKWSKFRNNIHNNAVYDNICEKNNNPIEITSNNKIWNDIKNISSDIFIKPGAKLTILGEINMSGSTTIIIENSNDPEIPSAELIIDGGIITCNCGSLWKGIEVWGDIQLSQLPQSNQGMVTIKNNAKIMNAEVGIYTGKRDDVNIFVDGSSGGIIYAKESSFINNKIAVKIYPYQNFNSSGYEIPNLSYFENCNFFTNNKISNNNTPMYFVYLDDILGIKFTGCNFENNTPESVYSGVDRGLGIISIASQYYVNGYCITQTTPCSEYKRSKFKNLFNGIRVLGESSAKTVSIERADFINNARGLYMGAVSDAKINFNTFEVPATDVINPYTYGLYLDVCSGYQVEENQFYGYDGQQGLLGIHILNSGPYANEIYNNDFENLLVGIIAAGENRNGTEEGLCLKCNDFADCETDIYVTPEGGVTTDFLGIALQQGIANHQSDGPAGNTFTYDYYPGLIYNYNNKTVPTILYIHHLDNNPLVNIQPDEIDNVNPEEDFLAYYIKEISCPSNLGGGIDIPAEMNTLTTEIIQITAYEDTLSQVTDGGDTDGLNFEVQTSFPNEAMQVRQELLDESPYLSDTVMKSAIYQENVLPNAMVRDVLVANPQSAKSEDVLGALDDRFNPMPDYMMAEIMQGQNTLGAKELLEQELAHHVTNRTRSFNKLIRHYKQDTINNWAQDSLLALLNTEPYPGPRYQAAFIYLENGDSVTVQNILNNIPTELVLTTRETFVHNLYSDLFNILIELQSDSVAAIDSIQEAALLNIEQYNHLLTGVYARNILLNHGLISYVEQVYLPDNLKSTPMWQNDKPDKKTNQKLLKVFPNPAGHYFIVEYDLRETEGRAVILLSDLNGRLVGSFIPNDKQNQQVISTDPYSPGIYILQLFIDNELVETHKIEIAK